MEIYNNIHYLSSIFTVVNHDTILELALCFIKMPQIPLFLINTPELKHMPLLPLLRKLMAREAQCLFQQMFCPIRILVRGQATKWSSSIQGQYTQCEVTAKGYPTKSLTNNYWNFPLGQSYYLTYDHQKVFASTWWSKDCERVFERGRGVLRRTGWDGPGGRKRNLTPGVARIEGGRVALSCHEGWAATASRHLPQQTKNTKI